MEIIDYRFITTDDNYSKEYNWWSRIYEYDVVKTFIDETKNGNIEIHNSAWGTDDTRLWKSATDHVKFRDSLNSIEKSNNIHSDVSKSINFDTYYYDITTDKAEFKEKFDYVVNISVIEHLDKNSQLKALKNLYNQVKPGGYLLLTFDYPRVNLNILSEFLGGVSIDKPKNILHGANSEKPNPKYKNLNIVLLTIKK